MKEDPNFVQKFKDLLRELLISRVKESDTLHLSLQGLPQDYAYEILLSNVASVVLLWFKKGGVESIEDIATIIAKAKEIPAVAKAIEGKNIVKEIYVPGRIVNIVAK